MTDKKPNNVIDFPKFVAERKLPEFDGVTQEQAQKIIDFFWDYLQMEIGFGLGLVDLDIDDEPEVEDLYYFNKIEAIYKEASGGCYFCDSTVDPHATPFEPKTANLCFMCVEKLTNFVQALGIDPTKVFKLAKLNPEQPRTYKDLWGEE